MDIFSLIYTIISMILQTLILSVCKNRYNIFLNEILSLNVQNGHFKYIGQKFTWIEMGIFSLIYTTIPIIINYNSKL